ncbi:hypothetical protein BN946_scf184714.g4 [Trametes cinnabarina]|uniref:DUF7770 domain-containing protein n=1 Tax=Pycnoporus cinnabarinus TaxID=5643 RepID=A0A060T020_PYCCI|nr:hypothetical protein BN946_scf184714.g4 [Trametes cinnabarina]
MATVYDKGLVAADKDRVVSGIVVTASGTVSTSPDYPNYFHWRFYLILQPSNTNLHAGMSQTHSVVFDMIPTNPPTGCFVITSKPESASTARLKIELPLATVGSPTVKQLIALFMEKGMNRYRFDDTGSGCLWWVTTGVRLLEQAGLLEAGACQKLEHFHHEHAKAHPERHPTPMRKGEFYW